MEIKVGKKIKLLRKKNDVTQDKLAAYLGVTPQAVSRWEANGGYPDMEMIPAIANYFHVSIDELFGYHDEREEKIKTIPKYVYPDSVLTSAIIQKIASHGQSLRILPDECCFTRSLDAQKNRGKALFGGGFLLSERAAAERWELSEREKNIIARLSYADR